MSGTMHVVCLKDTGHILAASSATTSSDTPDIEAVVGSNLPIANVRSTQNGTDVLGPARTLVPASLLELKSVPLDAKVVANPMNHSIDGGRIVSLPLLAAPPALGGLTSSTVILDGGTPETKGLCVVGRTGDPSDEHRVQSGKFVDPDGDGTADSLHLPLHILPGDTPASIESAAGDSYDIFIALEGMRPYWAMHVFP